MRRGVILLTTFCLVLELSGCALMTPSARECKETLNGLVEQNNRWHATITVRGSTEGGSDFIAAGETDIDVVGEIARTHGYMRVSGSYMAMEEQFDVIQENGTGQRYTLANSKSFWYEDKHEPTFQTVFRDMIETNNSTGRFINRTAKFNDKNCYYLSYNIDSTDIVKSFFPCSTKKVIGKDYIDDIEALSVTLYFASDKSFEGATVKCSGKVAVSMTVSKPTLPEAFELPERIKTLETQEDHPLLWNWSFYSPDGMEPLDIQKKTPSEDAVRQSEERGRNSSVINIEGHDIELPCMLSEFEDIGYTVNNPHNLMDSELREFTLTRENGDLIIATVFNEQTQKISFRDALVISITVASEENTNTAFVFPCGMQLMDSERSVQSRYGTPFERVDIDNTGNYMMCYYRIGTSMVALVSYYYDQVDEVEIGPIEYNAESMPGS